MVRYEPTEGIVQYAVDDAVIVLGPMRTKASSGVYGIVIVTVHVSEAAFGVLEMFPLPSAAMTSWANGPAVAAAAATNPLVLPGGSTVVPVLPEYMQYGPGYDW